jgi:glycosyltransferase involved in cell wall biosynthesis
MRQMADGTVVHVVPALFGPGGVVGGAERYALELAKAMANEVPTQLVTFGPNETTERDGELSVRVIGRPWRVRGQENNPISLRLFAALRSASIVHCHQQHVVASSTAALYCRMTGRRVFVSDLGGGGWDISAYLSTDRWYHGHLHISEYSRLVFGHGSNPKAHVILGGVDTNKFSPDPAVERTNEVLYVGRLLPHKGINYLIEAMDPDMELIIVGPKGDARYFTDLSRLAENKHVTFRHDCSDDELIGLYRRALCVVLPSVYTDMYGGTTTVPELLGQTLLEGMACGTPVICSEVASMPEVVADGETGFIVAPNDPAALGQKLHWFKEHSQESARMGTAARDRVIGNFTWPAVVQRCLEAYAK